MSGLVLGMTAEDDSVGHRRRRDTIAYLGEEDVFDISFSQSWDQTDHPNNSPTAAVKATNGLKSSTKESNNKYDLEQTALKEKKGHHLSPNSCITNNMAINQQSEELSSISPSAENSAYMQQGMDSRLVSALTNPLQMPAFLPYNDHHDNCVISSSEKCEMNHVHSPYSNTNKCLLYNSVGNAMTDMRNAVSMAAANKRRKNRKSKLALIRENSVDGYESDESFKSSFSDSKSTMGGDIDMCSYYSDEDDYPIALDELPSWDFDSADASIFFDPIDTGDDNISFSSNDSTYKVIRAPPPSPRCGSPFSSQSNIHQLFSTPTAFIPPPSHHNHQNNLLSQVDDNALPLFSFANEPFDLWLFEVD